MAYNGPAPSEKVKPIASPAPPLKKYIPVKQQQEKKEKNSELSQWFWLAVLLGLI